MDKEAISPDNGFMATAEQPSVIPPELQADGQAVIEHVMSGKPLAPETARRIRERAARIRQEIYQKHGLLDIGVPAIRELRDGE